MSMRGTAAQMTGNRTGIQTSPKLAEELIEGTTSAAPSSEGGAGEIAEYRGEYITEGFPIGSMPVVPATEEGEADEDEVGMAVLLDKLSERLAFERTGTRLYEALLNKCEMLGEVAPGPTLEEIEQIGSEELDHFLLLNDTIAGLGGDPTVQSPCADVAGVVSMGLLQVLTDPRSSLAHCLQAMLTAELTDNAGWELLIKLADNLGYDEMKTEFEAALLDEERHLLNVRTWLSECVLDSADV